MHITAIFYYVYNDKRYERARYRKKKYMRFIVGIYVYKY